MNLTINVEPRRANLWTGLKKAKELVFNLNTDERESYYSTIISDILFCSCLSVVVVSQFVG